MRQVLAHFAARHRIASVTQFDSLRIWLRLPALTDCKEIRHSASGIATCLNPNGIIWNDVRIMVNIVLLQMVTICLKAVMQAARVGHVQTLEVDMEFWDSLTRLLGRR